MSTQGKYAWEQAMEAEEERQKEALRKFLERERKRPQLHITGKSLLAFFGGVVLALAACGLFVWWADEALKRLGW